MSRRTQLIFSILCAISLSSCAIADLFKTEEYPKPVAPRAYVTGRLIDNEGNPLPHAYVISTMLSFWGEKVEYLPDEYASINLMATCDSLGYFYSFVYGQFKKDTVLPLGTFLGEIPMKFNEYDTCSKRWEKSVKLVKFEYDSILPYIRGRRGYSKKEAEILNGIIHTDLGNIILQKGTKGTMSGVSVDLIDPNDSTYFTNNAY